MQYLLQVGSGGRVEFEATSPLELLFGLLDGLARNAEQSFAQDGHRLQNICLSSRPDTTQPFLRCRRVWAGKVSADLAAAGEELEGCIAWWWQIS